MSLWIRMIRISDSSKRKLCKLESYSLTYLKNYPLVHQRDGVSIRKSITLLFSACQSHHTCVCAADCSTTSDTQWKLNEVKKNKKTCSVVLFVCHYILWWSRFRSHTLTQLTVVRSVTSNQPHQGCLEEEHVSEWINWGRVSVLRCWAITNTAPTPSCDTRNEREARWSVGETLLPSCLCLCYI